MILPFVFILWTLRKALHKFHVVIVLQNQNHIDKVTSKKNNLKGKRWAGLK